MRGRVILTGGDPYELTALGVLDVAWALFIDGFVMVHREKLIAAVVEQWDECPVFDPESFGTSARDQRLSAAAYKQAGGPAPLRQNVEVPEHVRRARERLAARLEE